MKTVIAMLCMVLSLAAVAGYKGKDPLEMSRTADRAGNRYFLYSWDAHPDDGMYQDLVCIGRKHMLLELPNGMAAYGCWWKVGGQLYGWTEYTKAIKFNMDLMSVNDNFTGKTGVGF